jgi:Flp pilus assembly protein TadG
MMSKLRLAWSWTNRVSHCESGSALVEMAFTLPVLLLLLLGAAELGDMSYRATEMSNAARAAAQYAAMNGGAFTDCNGTFAGGTCSPTSGIVAAAKADAPWASSRCTNFVVKAVSSCTCSNSTACAGPTNYSCTTGQPLVSITVTTTASCGGVATILVNNSFNLQGFAQQEVLH